MNFIHQQMTNTSQLWILDLFQNKDSRQKRKVNIAGWWEEHTDIPSKAARFLTLYFSSFKFKIDI